MNRASILAFGITAAVLAAATWNDTTLTADEEGAVPLNALRAEGVTITAERREVEVPGEGRTLYHLFLIVEGRGKGSVSLTLESMGGNPLSRVVMPSEVVWENTVAFDQAGGTTEMDLGPWPGSQTKGDSQKSTRDGSTQLVATSGSSAAILWAENPAFDLIVESLEHAAPANPVKADE